MRPCSIGPVKSYFLLRSDLNEIREVIYAARDRGGPSSGRPRGDEYLRSQNQRDGAAACRNGPAQVGSSKRR